MEIWGVFVHENNLNNMSFIFAICVKGVCMDIVFILLLKSKCSSNFITVY